VHIPITLAVLLTAQATDWFDSKMMANTKL